MTVVFVGVPLLGPAEANDATQPRRGGETFFQHISVPGEGRWRAHEGGTAFKPVVLGQFDAKWAGGYEGYACRLIPRSEDPAVNYCTPSPRAFPNSYPASHISLSGLKPVNQKSVIQLAGTLSYPRNAPAAVPTLLPL
ncbi:hypothetical protein VC83_06719 [Pseudogymnoascus destructans]|uniref:Uncharacterized protein n=1 Tax=Pseudogymnoascus destructans TaxID=655981 RepID=A0A177A3S8_9PEZI|nr:uncharacterized protein VC83_06719 [Pseudogymnoascus destructans]OAF56250.1 hypothetical protein VC83_06719 [Pseudogymnoascus destructans]